MPVVWVQNLQPLPTLGNLDPVRTHGQNRLVRESPETVSSMLGGVGSSSVAPSCWPVGEWMRVIPIYEGQETLFKTLDPAMPKSDPRSSLSGHTSRLSRARKQAHGYPSRQARTHGHCAPSTGTHQPAMSHSANHSP